jgi:hypothetical protein
MTQTHNLSSGARPFPPLRDHAVVPPLTVTVARACELSGFGQTSIWAFLKNGRLVAVRLPGVRRTLVSYESLRRLLALPFELESSPPTEGASKGLLPKRSRSRLRKAARLELSAAQEGKDG